MTHRNRKHPLILLLLVLSLGLVLAACGGDDEESSAPPGSDSGGETASGNEIQPVEGAESKTIKVGSKNFTEQYILGEIYSQALAAAGYKVEKQLDLGSELLAYKALQNGQVDAYPEYTGTALTSFFGVKTADVPRDAQQAYEDAKAGFAEKNITALAPTPFENTYRLGMTKEKAAEIGDPKVISDLKGKEGDLSITGFPECKQRQDCLLGVEETYGLDFGKFVTSEQKYQVLDSGDADVAFIFTTDGDLASGKYVILDDDKKFFPPYNVTFNIRDEKLEELGPEAQEIVEKVQEPLDERVMQELNARVDVDKQKPDEVAKAYLEQAGFLPKS